MSVISSPQIQNTAHVVSIRECPAWPLSQPLSVHAHRYPFFVGNERARERAFFPIDCTNNAMGAWHERGAISCGIRLSHPFISSDSSGRRWREYVIVQRPSKITNVEDKCAPRERGREASANSVR